MSDDEASAFERDWNALERPERLRIRRLVRMGRKVEPPELAPLGPGYARWQMRRPWMRFFPFWFIPGILLALSVTAQIHPILVGVTIALGAQAIWAYISLRKTARRT